MDGAYGRILYLIKIGAQVYVQDPVTSLIKSLPEATMNLTKIDRILSSADIRNYILSIK